MHFVRHATKPDWGLGVISSEDGANVDVLFEGVGTRKLAKTFQGLVDVPAAEVPKAHRLRKQDDWPDVDRDGKRAQAKRDLPKRFDGLVNELLASFPDGFRSKECDAAERDDKVAASELARAELSPAAVDELIASNDFAEIIKRTKRVLARMSLALPGVLTKLGDVPTDAQRSFAEHIGRLVNGGAETPEALEELAEDLEPLGAAKWPLVSALPSLLDPEHWPFVRPALIDRAVKATGIDVEYDTAPNARTYVLVRELYEHVGAELTTRGMAPRDFFDVQTFLWAASGMARELKDGRAKKAVAKAASTATREGQEPPQA